MSSKPDWTWPAESRGRLHGGVPSVDGDSLSAVNDEISYADGRRDKLHLVDQLIPFYALQRRE